MNQKVLTIPLKEQDVRELRVGDVVYLNGIILTSRDMAHLKIKEILAKGQELPVNFEGGVIFHAGPVVKQKDDGSSPENKGSSWDMVVIGPTTSIRMEPYAEMVGKLGVRAIIGKGGMDEDTLNACKQYGYVYLQAAPGCAVKLAAGINSVKDVYWLELGMPEALWVLEANRFGPLVVGMDTHGRSIYKELTEKAYEKLG
jgi:tartrate/fumarate subfamily iron-sulfur-dependent hydro-lyase beta chain